MYWHAHAVKRWRLCVPNFKFSISFCLLQTASQHRWLLCVAVDTSSCFRHGQPLTVVEKQQLLDHVLIPVAAEGATTQSPSFVSLFSLRRVEVKSSSTSTQWLPASSESSPSVSTPNSPSPVRQLRLAAGSTIALLDAQVIADQDVFGLQVAVQQGLTARLLVVKVPEA